MTYSNRAEDLVANKRMQKVMNAIYNMLGWDIWRPNITEWDMRGLDILLKRPGDSANLWVDEKAATKYWDKDIQTFACELTTKNNQYQYGWFANESNDYLVTTHLLFIWVRALEKELIHISSLRFLVLNKHDLQKYFSLVTGLTPEQDTKKYLAGITWDAYGKHKINDDITLKRSALYPEFPVNALISKRMLEKLAVDGGEFTRLNVRDALREYKNVSATERIRREF